MAKTVIACETYGVGQGEEGVCLGLTLGPYHLLLDCGLRTLDPLGEKPPDWVFCSHAHADHARGLESLHQRWPQVPIAASGVTTQLLPLQWPEVPFSQIQQFCRALPWREPMEILPRLTVELFPAGHLPGAALILLTYRENDAEGTLRARRYRVIYTGDYCLSHLPLVEGLALGSLRGCQPDVLIVEGQYGTRRLPHRRHQEKQFLHQIEGAIASQRHILLPVPPLGLAQEILKLLRTHHQFTGRPIQLWAGGNVVAGCDSYGKILGDLPPAVQNFAQYQPLFWDDRVYPHLRPLSPDFNQLSPGLTQIVVTDGWPDGWPDPEKLPGEWTVLLPQLVTLPPLKPGLTWEDLAQWDHYDLADYLLGDHSDGRNTTQLIHNLRPQHLVFVHGKPADLQDLTGLEELHSRYQLHCPTQGSRLPLPLGVPFNHPSPPRPTRYEGEVQESDPLNPVVLALDGAIAEDSRWAKLSETGLLEARWQGEELVIRGLSQRELIRHHQQTKRLENLDCCANCRYFHDRHCWNQASPLGGLVVKPEGCCPVFEGVAGRASTDPWAEDGAIGEESAD